MVFIECHRWVHGYYALHTPLMLCRTHGVIALHVPVVRLWAYGSEALHLPSTCLQSRGSGALHAWMAVQGSHGYYALHEIHCQCLLGLADCLALRSSDSPHISQSMVLVWSLVLHRRSLALHLGAYALQIRSMALRAGSYQHLRHGSLALPVGLMALHMLAWF